MMKPYNVQIRFWFQISRAVVMKKMSPINEKIRSWFQIFSRINKLLEICENFSEFFSELVLIQQKWTLQPKPLEMKAISLLRYFRYVNKQPKYIMGMNLKTYGKNSFHFLCSLKKVYDIQIKNKKVSPIKLFV